MSSFINLAPLALFLLMFRVTQKKRNSSKKWVAYLKIAHLPLAIILAGLAFYSPPESWAILSKIGGIALCIAALYYLKEGLIQLRIISRGYKVPDRKGWRHISLKEAKNLPNEEGDIRKYKILNSLINYRQFSG